MSTEEIRLDENTPSKPFFRLDEVVANVESIIGDVTDHERNLIKQWAWLGERELGFGGFTVQTQKIDVQDLSAKKPRDMAMPLDMAVYEGNDREVEYSFHADKSGRIHLKGNYERYIDISEDPYFFYFDSNAANVTHIHIRYHAYPITEDGEPMFPNHHLLAIMMFCKWMIALRRARSLSEINEAERMWRMQRSMAKSQNIQLHPLKARRIAKTWSSMIDKFNHEVY